ncbi:MAG: type II toxin-antitoxin system VapC family toxin [Gammaproteobacteria bacterium]
MYLLDTNVCIHLLNHSHSSIHDKFMQQSPSELALCSVVKAELIFGARNSSKVESNLKLLKSFFKPLISLPFDDKAAEEYGIIRADLTRQGKIIGPNDLMIASIAKAFDTTLVTNNTKEFSRISNLRIEDWQEQ